MRRPSHLPTVEQIERWPAFSPERPLRVLASGCLTGRACGYDGTSYGDYPVARQLLALPNVSLVEFCPEDSSFGTPRALCDIHGGDGFDVLEGRARVKTDAGADWTDGMVRAGRKMAELGVASGAHLALLTDISAACGSTNVYDGPRRLRVYRQGPGVAAACVLAAGIPVVSQRDFRTLGRILGKLGRPDLAPQDGVDHHEGDWYRSHFGDTGR